MYKRADESMAGQRQHGEQILAAGRAFQVVSGRCEDAFDLPVEFVTISHDHHAAVRTILQDPFGQQRHDDALAAALRVPDGPTEPLLNVLLGRLDAEVLMGSRYFLDAGVKK